MEGDTQLLAEKLKAVTKEQENILKLIDTIMKAQEELKDKYGIMYKDMYALDLKYDMLAKDVTEIKDTVKDIPVLINKLDTCAEKITEQVSISKKQQESISNLANKDAKKAQALLSKVAGIAITVIVTALVTYALAKAGIA